jgi:TonB-dependent starch-binding outer membrane protein SusC
MVFRLSFVPPVWGLTKIPPVARKIMRITTILLLGAALHVSASGFSQKVTLSLNNVPVQKVFTEVIRQTGVSIVYTESIFNGMSPVTINVKDATVQEVLDQCLKDQPLTYTMQGLMIVIARKPNPTTSEYDNTSPPVDVRGHVTDSLGNPIAGASVTVKGRMISVATDANGNFYLRDINSTSTLIISSIGFETQEYKLKGKNDILLRLKVHSTSLLDVVVNKGYYNTTNRLNTGDVSIVTADVIEKQPVTDPILALEGRVPGLYIQQASGVPGAYSTIQIRGQNSMVNGNDPLYIVDGVPFSSTTLTSRDIGGGVLGTPPGNGIGMSPFNSLNPADIASIEVLKDADATAIYGSRGANGVILITTKKGKSRQTNVDINMYTGFNQVTRNLNLINTSQYLQMRREAFNNDGTTPGPYDFDINGIWDTTRNTNWQKVLIDNPAFFTNAQASISGGTPNTQFLLSGGYSNQGTTYPGSYSDQKASGHISIINSSNDHRFKTDFTANYVNDINNLPIGDLTQSIILAPDAPALYDQQGNINWQIMNGAATFSNNPIAFTVTHSNAITDNLITNLVLSYEFFPGLRFKSNFGYNKSEMDQTILTPSTYYAPPDNLEPSLRSNQFATTISKSWIIEPQINFDRKIAKGLLDFLIGTTFQENTRSSIGYYASGFTSDALITNPQAASSVTLAGSSSTLYHYNAFFGRISYNWDEKYLLNVTGRRDGSSRFGPGKQFGNFGAIGVGWIFSREQFIQNSLPFLSFGKLRASYGITGNDQIGDYQFLSTYTSNYLSYQGINTLFPTALTNPNFAWELNKKEEGGLELGFIRDRIFFSASYYRDRSNNQLVEYPLTEVTGFGGVEANSQASVQNTGLEFTLNLLNIKSKYFTWASSVNLSIPRNKLIAFPGFENSPYKYTFAIGHPLSIKYVFHYTGIDPQSGTYTFASKDGSGVPSYPNDLTISKPVTQSFYGGINNSFGYKGFHLDIFFQFVKQLGYNYFGSTYNNLPGTPNTNQPNFVLNRWQNPGDIATFQKFTNGGGPAYTGYYFWSQSDAAISDASFIRLKNLAFSYDLPSEWQKKCRMQNARVYMQCQNLITITSFQGLDPETGGGLILPPLRTITIGLQMGL